MSSTLATFLFETANFALLALFLGWLFFRPVRRALEERQAKLAAEAAEAAAKLTEAERMRVDADAAHRGLARDLETIREEARAAARREAEAIRGEARAHANRERELLGRELASQERARASALARTVAAVARDLVARLLGRIEGPELDRALLAAAYRELGSFAGAELGRVTVESARALDDGACASLAAAFGAAARTAEYRVVPELGAGLRILTDRGLIDASASGIAAHAERELSSRLERLAAEAPPGG